MTEFQKVNNKKKSPKKDVRLLMKAEKKRCKNETRYAKNPYWREYKSEKIKTIGLWFRLITSWASVILAVVGIILSVSNC